MDYKKYRDIIVPRLKSLPKSILNLSIFPAKLLATFGGIGNLPEWQNAWTGFFTLIIILIVVYTSGILQSSLVDLSVSLLTINLMAFIAGGLAIFLVHLEEPEEKERLTIPVAIGLLTTISIALPAILKIVYFFISLAYSMCAAFLYCNIGIYKLLCFGPPFFIIYLTYLLVEWLQFWPNFWLTNTYNSGLSRMCEALINSLYAAFILYLSAFMFLNLEILDVINLYKLSINKMKLELLEFISFLTYSSHSL